MIKDMSTWRLKTWRFVLYTAVNAPLAVLAFWLPYKDGIPALAWLWAGCVMLGDPGTPLMIGKPKEGEE
jgi:hypothetical protein